MQLNVDKFYLAKESVEYIGYIISREGIKPQPSNVQIIVDMPKPNMVTPVKRDASMINFYRDLWKKRVQHCCVIMEMTREKKKGPITWTGKAEKVCESFKKICTEDVMLHYPDFNKEFEVHTDSTKWEQLSV